LGGIRFRDLFDPGSGIKQHSDSATLKKGMEGKKAYWLIVGRLPGGKLSFAGRHPDYEEGSSYSDADYTRDQRVLNDL
jgi:hypothetical protein